MASTHKHIRSSTANKRPTTAIADGQIALNTNSASPGLFFKDSTGATIIKIGPVHVGATAPNASPAAGGSAGNSSGEVWLDNSLTPVGVKIWDGSAWVNATPIGSTTVQGLLELATDAETQAGSDNARAVTPASLQSKVSDSTSTTSSTTIASSTAVKAAYDLANAALPKTGGTVTGNLEIGTTGSLSFEGSTADGFETTIAVVDPTADRTITLPNTTGTVVTTGDTGTVTSTMLADGTIVDADISATAEIAVSKLADGAARQLLQTDAAGTGVEWTSNIDIPGTLDVTGAAAFDSNVAVTGALTKSGSNVVTVGDTGTVTSTMIANDTIVNADINSAAAIAGTKISPDFGSQTITTSGLFSHALGTAGAPTITFTGDLNTGIYSPGADQVAISTNGTGRLFVDASGNVKISTGEIFQTSASSYIRLDGGTGAGNGANVIVFGESHGSAPGRIALTAVGTGAILASTGGTERLRITSAGLVGVGTSSPGSLLHVGGGAAGVTQLTLQGGSVGGDYGILSIQNGSTSRGRLVADAGVDELRIDTAGGASTKIQFKTGSGYTNALTIDSSQRVGIGTSSPGDPFHIAVSGANSANIRLQSGDGRTYNVGSTGSGYGSSGKFIIYDITAGAERFCIDSSGRVGIGFTSVEAALHAGGNSASPVIFAGTSSGDVTYKFRQSRGTITSPDDTGGEGVRLSFEKRSPSAWASPIAEIYAAGAGSGGDGYLAFLTKPSGGSATERARIDSSGRLLVGTSTSPSAGALTQYANFVARGNTGGPGFAGIITVGRGEAATSITSGEEIGYLTFSDLTGNEFATIQCAADANAGAGDYPGRLVFSTTADGASSPTERMRIGNDGITRLFVTNNDGFQSRSSGAAGTTLAVYVGLHSATSTTTGNITYVVWNNGNVVNANNSYGSLSDLKLKENIVDATSQWSDIKALQVRKYNFKEGQTHTQIGLIAQEVELVSPGLVTESPDRDAEGNDLGTVTKSVNYSVLYMKAVKALQEAMERIEQLETEKAEQQTVLDDLLARVAALEAA